MSADKYNGSNDYYPKKIGKISYPDDTENYWRNFREDVCKVIEKSQKPQNPSKTTQGDPQRSQDQKGRSVPQPAVVKPPKTI